MKMLLIAVGGAIGSCLRFWVMNYVQASTARTTINWFGHALPIGTLAVNVIGCFVIGLVSGLFTRNAVPHEHYRLALTVGVLGGFTTFSAFGLDTFALMENGRLGLALLNVVISCTAGVVAVWIGFRLAT